MTLSGHSLDYPVKLGCTEKKGFPYSCRRPQFVGAHLHRGQEIHGIDDAHVGGRKVPGQPLRARRGVRAYGVDGSNAIRFGFSRETPGAPPTLPQPVRHRKVLHAKCLRTDHLVLIGRCSPSTDRHGCSKRKSARTRLNKSGCSMWAPWAQPGRMQRRAFGIPSHRTTESEGLVERSISPTTTKVGIFNS